MRLPRFIHRLYAQAGGYFWLPCDICGREFGGHESPNGRIHRRNGSAWTTCPNCPGDFYLVNGFPCRPFIWFDEAGVPAINGWIKA